MDAAPDLRSLLARRELRLQLDEGTAQSDPVLDRTVRWVHSSDLIDPTPFLSEGLVLLTTGTQFAETEDADAAPRVYDDYVARLVTRGVLALGFGTEVARDGIPLPLATACRAHGIPLFEVPYKTPFIAVARANAEAIAAESYARRSWALAAQRAISLAALRPDGLGATLAELARQLDAWVGMFDAAGVLTREHPGALAPETADHLHHEVGAVLRRGARAGSSLQIGGTPFTLQTLGRGGHLRGVIAIARGDLDQEGRGVVTSVIAMAGLALEQNVGFSRARGSMRAGLMRSLLSGDPALARRIARDLWGSFPRAPLDIAVTDARSAGVDAVIEFLEAHAAETKGELFFGRSGDGLVIVVPTGERVALKELTNRFGVRMGLSTATSLSGFADAADQARTARDRGTESLTVFGEMAHVGVLSALSSDARPLALAQLRPVLDHDASSGTHLFETLRAWLDNDCSHESCARQLGVHRHTVRSRLGQIEELLGRDLGAFATRAEMWAALRALD